MNLNRMFQSYCKQYEYIWENTSDELSKDIEVYSKDNQIQGEKDLDRLIDTVLSHLDKYPKDFILRKIWIHKGEEFLQRTLEKENILKLEKIDVEERKKFLDVTKNFIRDAREFDNELSIEDIMQAMRNIWIANALQMLFGYDISYSKASFAYSMLYPYTDNYLDNIDISESNKVLFNNWLEKRLLGEIVGFKNPNQNKLHQMVSYIENTYNRDDFKEVYESLLLIFRGQVKSLKQQEQDKNLSKDEILSISIEKGGSSVLVDGFLINGSMTDEEIKFCIGYGFLLQMADDLQDIKENLKCGHRTVMSELSKEDTLDKVVNKLINFTIDLIDNFRIDSDSENIKSMVKNDCLMLILFSIVYNKEFFSSDYMRKIEKFLPYTLSYSSSLKENLQDKFKAIDILNDDVTCKEIIDIICAK